MFKNLHKEIISTEIHREHKEICVWKIFRRISKLFLNHWWFDAWIPYRRRFWNSLSRFNRSGSMLLGGHTAAITDQQHVGFLQLGVDFKVNGGDTPSQLVLYVAAEKFLFKKSEKSKFRCLLKIVKLNNLLLSNSGLKFETLISTRSINNFFSQFQTFYLPADFSECIRHFSFPITPVRFDRLNVHVKSGETAHQQLAHIGPRVPFVFREGQIL